MRPSDSAASDTFYIFPYHRSKKEKPALVSKTYPGVVKLAYERPTDLSQVKMLMSIESDSAGHADIPYLVNPTSDTITININASLASTFYLQMKSDTNTFIYTYKPKSIDSLFKIIGVSYSENRIELKSPQIIQSINQNKFYLVKDSTKYAVDSISFSSSRIQIYFPSDKKIKLYAETGAIQDINGEKNVADSFVLIPSKEELSTFNLTITEATNVRHIIQLLRDDKLINQQVFRDQFVFSYSNLKTGKYRLRIISDLNENDIWDTGDFINGISPEPIYLSESLELRPNWDKDLVIKDL
jgi:uncharacterized protein (DUF2141 family)